MEQQQTKSPANGAGVGLRLPHLAQVAAARPKIAWLEIHPENFLANPHASELLDQIAADYPISVHTVGVSVGSVDGVDREHLKRVCELVDRVDPFIVSGHLAWSTHPGEYLNDLLPLPYNEESLAVIARHVDEVQEGLGRPYLVENPSSYVGFKGSTMNEVEFLTELVARTGCKLLCDVSNIHVSGHNMNYDPYVYIDGLPGDAIAEMHLGGFTIEEDGESGGEVLVDTHDKQIADPAWRLYAYALRRFGPRPTLIEWDAALPPFATLLAEAAHAEQVASQVLDEAEVRVAAR